MNFETYNTISNVNAFNIARARDLSQIPLRSFPTD